MVDNLDFLTITICGLIVVVLLCAIFQVFRNSATEKRFVVLAPGLMTSIGVAGTFLGIALALQGFNVEDIDASVPTLLAGMKTAFWSSVAGLSSAITLRFITLWVRTSGGVGVSTDPIEVLQDMSRNIVLQTNAISGTEDSSLLTQIKLMRTDSADTKNVISAGFDAQVKEFRNFAKQMTDAIAGTEDSSLLTQMKLMRTETGDMKNVIAAGFEQQIKEFREFAEQMAENNSKALIEALEAVIRDFNTNLTEQFGENFKQLNEGVGKLVEWQERYKDHLETMETKVEFALNAVEETEKLIKEIAKSVEPMPTHVAALGATLIEVGEGIGGLKTLLSGLDDLSSKVGESYPRIEKNIADLTVNLQKSAEEQSKALAETSVELNRTTKENLDAIQVTLTGTIDNLTENLKAAAEDQASTLQNTSDDLNRITKENLDTIQSTLTGSFEAFDNQMQDETTRVLQLLGDQLASITGKITSDYDEFAKAAELVVSAAAKVSIRSNQ